MSPASVREARRLLEWSLRRCRLIAALTCVVAFSIQLLDLRRFVSLRDLDELVARRRSGFSGLAREEHGHRIPRRANRDPALSAVLQ